MTVRRESTHDGENIREGLLLADGRGLDLGDGGVIAVAALMHDGGRLFLLVLIHGVAWLRSIASTSGFEGN